MQMSVQTENHVVRTDDALVCRASGLMELWTDERPDGMTHRPNSWQGTEISDL